MASSSYSPQQLEQILIQMQQEYFKYQAKTINTTATAGSVTNGYWIQKPARKENIRYLNKPEVRNDEA